MDIKIFLTILSLISCSNCAGMLRRTPKVYNALITTDENLTPSRAFPVIQPTIHETGIAHYPYGPYNPYRIFHPPIVHLSSPAYEGRQIPSFVQQHHEGPLSYDGPPPPPQPPTGPYHQQQGPPYETNQIGLPPQPAQPPYPPHPVQMPQPPQQQFNLIPQQGYPNYHPQQQSQPPQIESNLPVPESKQEPLPVIPAQANEKQSPQESQQPPQQPQQPLIPLNEYGLPPSLIPLHTYQSHHPQLPPPSVNGPIPLQPYSFSTYPLVYDQYSPYHTHPGHDNYLPHFGYYPPYSYGIPIHRPGKNRPKDTSTSSPSSPATSPNDIDPNLSSTDSGENVTEPSSKQQSTDSVPLNNIKNGIENKNKNIPDVPPPPLPAGAKKVQRIITL